MTPLNELERDVRMLARVMFELRGDVLPTFVVFAGEAMWSFQMHDPKQRNAAIEVVRRLIKEKNGEAVALFSHGSGVKRPADAPPPRGPVDKERDHFRCLFVYVESPEGIRTSMAPIRYGKPEEWTTSDPHTLVVPLRVPEFFRHMRN